MTGLPRGRVLLALAALWLGGCATFSPQQRDAAAGIAIDRDGDRIGPGRDDFRAGLGLGWGFDEDDFGLSVYIGASDVRKAISLSFKVLTTKSSNINQRRSASGSVI